MTSFYMSKQTTKAKQERLARMRRAKSMPKIEDEEEKSIVQLKNHLQSFFEGSREDRQKRSKSQVRDQQDGDSCERRTGATTPGKGLIEGVSLKPVGERTPKNMLEPLPPSVDKCEYKNHFRDFMKTPTITARTPNTVKRGRSFS